MKKETSNKLYSFLYLLALYLGIQMLPIATWISTEWISNLIKIGLYLLLIGLMIYELKRSQISHQSSQGFLSYLLCIPLIIGCMSNFIYCWFFGTGVAAEIDAGLFVETTFITLGGVVIEELLFRMFYLSFLKDMLAEKKFSKELCILFSALAFGLMHVINFFGNNPLNVLAQIGYTSVLGLVLGFIAVYFESPILPIVGHFLFNYLNTDLVLTFYEYDFDTRYVLFSVGIGAVLLIYLILIYYFTEKKQHAAS